MQSHGLDGGDGKDGGRKCLDGRMESDQDRGMLSGSTLAHVARKMDDWMWKIEIDVMEDLC